MRQMWFRTATHNLMRDFQDEIPGYTKNAEIARLLSELSLKSGPDGIKGNLLACYEHLVAHRIFPSQELPLLRAWLTDLDAVLKSERLSSAIAS
jgi:hypothetical protein